jgi:hypothetical protein
MLDRICHEQVDMWSMGVVFYEMFNNQMLAADKDKQVRHRLIPVTNNAIESE